MQQLCVEKWVTWQRSHLKVTVWVGVSEVVRDGFARPSARSLPRSYRNIEIKVRLVVTGCNFLLQNICRKVSVNAGGSYVDSTERRRGRVTLSVQCVWVWIMGRRKVNVLIIDIVHCWWGSGVDCYHRWSRLWPSLHKAVSGSIVRVQMTRHILNPLHFVVCWGYCWPLQNRTNHVSGVRYTASAIDSGPIEAPTPVCPSAAGPKNVFKTFGKKALPLTWLSASLVWNRPRSRCPSSHAFSSMVLQRQHRIHHRHSSHSVNQSKWSKIWFIL